MIIFDIIFWNKIKDKIEFYKRPLEEAIRGNDTLREPTSSPADREALLSLIGSMGFERAVGCDDQYKRNLRSKRISYVSKALKKVLPQSVFEFLKKSL